MLLREIHATKIQDTRYFILSFRVYNYTHLGLFTHMLKIIHTYETKCD